MKLNTIHLSDNIEYIRTMPDNSIDSIITDSPYGLGKEPKAAELITNWVTKGYHEIKGTGFMGKKWDAFVPQPALWKECYRVLKPGGYLLSFFGTRTYDWGTLAIRLAGFEIRDCIQWIYGSGFPKGKACLKPANEPICVARKPGPLQMLNIDECRIPMADTDTKGAFGDKNTKIRDKEEMVYGKFEKRIPADQSTGRWPSNIIIDEEVAELVDEQSGISGGGKRTFRVEVSKDSTKTKHGGLGIEGGRPVGFITSDYNDIGGASRFFYVAKASPSERKGLTHPTIKPVKLMIQLVKLYCPVGGVVLDPHMGSGSTAIACLESARNYIGIDNDSVSHQEANNRIADWHKSQSKTIQTTLL